MNPLQKATSLSNKSIQRWFPAIPSGFRGLGFAREKLDFQQWIWKQPSVDLALQLIWDLFLRKNLLQRYKFRWWYPFSSDATKSFTQNAGRMLPGLSSTYSEFCPTRFPTGWGSLKVLFGHREWAFIRLTGLCPLWQRPDLHCSETLVAQAFLRSGLSNHVWMNLKFFLFCLFHSSGGLEVDTARIRYVGLVMRRVCTALQCE